MRYFALLILLMITSGCGNTSVDSEISDNQPPEITSFTAEPQIVSIGSTASIIVNASDPENDILRFGWDSSGGSITGNGSSATWRAPENMGTYLVSIFIEDDRLGAANATLTIQVVDSGSDNRPPVINYISANPDIMPALGQTSLSVGASDPDGDDVDLLFFWGGPGGNFDGDGASVVWTSPPPACCPTIYSIWVMVKDSEGATNTQSVEVTVIP